MTNESKLPVEVWRKSSYSGENGGDCVEMSIPHSGAIAVRDSKDPNGPRLMVSREAWQAFVDFAARQTV